MRSLAAFGATVWLLADVGRQGQGGTASSVVQRLTAVRWFGVVRKCWTGCKEGCGIARGTLRVVVAVGWLTKACPAMGSSEQRRHSEAWQWSGGLRQGVECLGEC